MKRHSIFLIALMSASCSSENKKHAMDQPDSITTLAEASPAVEVYTLTNRNGLKMDVTNFGGRIISLWVPDRMGALGDVVLGYDSASQYLKGNPFFGAVVGRFSNRIAKGNFEVGGNVYQLALNNNENTLHGGSGGFHNVFWVAKEKNGSTNRLELSYLSKDGEEGFPGNLNVTLVYTLTDDNGLAIEYSATTDKATIVNLTQHSYFNLAGAGNGDILNTEMMINADYFTPVDEGLIPSGELRKVDGTPFDFRKPHKIGERIDTRNEQLQFGKGYDHNWVLNKKDKSLTLAARATDPVSGRVMEVWTTEPGLQFYTGNHLTGRDKGKGGKVYNYRSGFCLETEHFPDSPNHKDFPSTVLKPGEKYEQKTVYKFLVDKL